MSIVVYTPALAVSQSNNLSNDFHETMFFLAFLSSHRFPSGFGLRRHFRSLHLLHGNRESLKAFSGQTNYHRTHDMTF